MTDAQPGDEFFSAAQIQRLSELMTKWRSARNAGAPFPPEEQTELDSLIAEELKAASARSAALLRTRDS